MSLQLCPAPPFLSNTPFCGHSNCTHLGLGSLVQTKQLSATFTSRMDNTGSLRLNLDGPTLGAGINKTSASPSPGLQSASVIMTASPYPNLPPSTSSKQMMSSDAPLERESKRPRIIRSHSGALSGVSTDVSDPTEHQSIDGGHDHLDINYSENHDMVSQSSSSMGLVTSSAMPNDTYPVVGTPYWSSNSLSTDIIDKSTSEDSDANNSLGGEGGAQSQMYGSGVAWGGQEMSMPMNPIQQYVPRRMVNGSWEPEVSHHQQPHQSHQHMMPDGSLSSPYESSSGYGDCHSVNGQTHRMVPSNGYDTPVGMSAPTTPHHTPGPTSAWPQTAFHGPGGSMGGSRLAVPGMHKDIKPKILASSTSSMPKRSPVQQRAATPTKSERAKTGDRTTHNDVERKYRTNLKDRIAELRAAVPALQAQHDESDGTTSNAAPKVSKGTVLSKATEYIQQLEQANRVMMSEHQQLVDRLHTLEAMLQNAGARPPQYTSNHGMSMFDPRGFN